MHSSQKPGEEASKAEARPQSNEELSEQALESVAGGVMFDGNGKKTGRRDPNKIYPASGVPSLQGDGTE